MFGGEIRKPNGNSHGPRGGETRIRCLELFFPGRSVALLWRREAARSRSWGFRLYVLGGDEQSCVHPRSKDVRLRSQQDGDWVFLIQKKLGLQPRTATLCI